MLTVVRPHEEPTPWEAYSNGWCNALEAVRTGKVIVPVVARPVQSPYPAYAPLEERNTGPQQVDVSPLQAMPPRMRWKAMKAMHPEAGYETMEHYVFGKGDMEP